MTAKKPRATPAAQLLLFPAPAVASPARSRQRVATRKAPPLDVVARCQRGDLWQLGAHRLLCGDAASAQDVARLMGGAQVEACVTDPPYGIKWNTDHRRFTGGEAKHFYAHHRKAYIPVRNDNRAFDPRPYLTFNAVVLWGANNYSDALPPGALLVWDKRTPSGHALLADGEAAWMNHGRGVYILSHMWHGALRKDNEPRFHPTQKPIALMEWCLAKSKAGATVYDPYCGSGPVLLACERTGRACYGMEIEPHYCDVTLARWEQMTGQRAALVERAELPA